MAVTDRKAREKEELKTLILNAATKLFAEKGVENVTIRNIAEVAEYSVGTIYVYFKDKNAIFHALHTKGFTTLRGQFQVLNVVADPMERLRASVRLYIQFAFQNPDMYDLMFNLEAPADFVNEWADVKWNEGRATFGFVRDVVQDCINAGHFNGHRAESLAFMVWGMVHGMCHLAVTQRSCVVDLTNPVEEGYAAFLTIINKL